MKKLFLHVDDSYIIKGEGVDLVDYARKEYVWSYVEILLKSNMRIQVHNEVDTFMIGPRKHWNVLWFLSINRNTPYICFPRPGTRTNVGSVKITCVPSA